MRVLIANKFWYRRGGDCIYSINLERELRERGIITSVFAMRHPENIKTAFDEYFPHEISFIGMKGKLGTAVRAIGLGEVRTKFAKLLNDFKPDILHLNNVHTQLSPVLAEIAHKRGIKVVWTLHDYKLLCPRYDCRQKGKRQCEECFDCKIPVLTHKCMKNSLPASVLAYIEAIVWNRRCLDECVDIFICPSDFIRKKMIQGGFNAGKLHHLCNFIDIGKCRRTDYSCKSDYYCYVGRLSDEKGIRTLVSAASKLPYKLVIVGDGPLKNSFEAQATMNVEFAGRKGWDDVKEILSKARFMVIPSECYENNPLSVIESRCLGTPVLGANIGGIPELIEDESIGMTFSSGDAEDLALKIGMMFTAQFDYRQIAKTSMEKFNSESYYNSLMNLYCNNK